MTRHHNGDDDARDRTRRELQAEVERGSWSPRQKGLSGFLQECQPLFEARSRLG